MDSEELWEVIQEQAESGVNFMAMHCGVTRRALERLRREGRVTDVVSRGGALLVGWMLHHDRENPLYEDFPRLLEIARCYDVTLSLGDGMRPGCLADATHRAELEELVILQELVDEARRATHTWPGPGDDRLLKRGQLLLPWAPTRAPNTGVSTRGCQHGG